MLDRNKHQTLLYGGLAAASAIGLYAIGLYHYSFFYALIQLFTITFSFSCFLLSWTARHLLANDCLKLIGIGYAFTAIMDFLHALVYQGIYISPNYYNADLANQLWIAARYLQAATLCAAPCFVNRRIKEDILLAIYFVAVTLLTAMIYSGKFPTCYIHDQNPSTFQSLSEYAIIAIILTAFFLFYKIRNALNNQTYGLIIASLACTVLSAISLIAHRNVYHPTSLLGHILNLAALYFISHALVVTVLKASSGYPAPKLQQGENAFHKTNKDPGKELPERTAALQTNEEKYRAAFHAAEDGILIHDMAGRLLETNGAVLKMFGYANQEETLTTSYKDTLFSNPPYSIKEAREYVRLARAGKPQMFEWLTRKKDGAPLWIEVVLRCCVIGGQKCILTTVRDINERKRTETELQENKTNLEAAQAMTKTGSWDLDIDSGIGHWSKEMFHLFNLDPRLGPPRLTDFMEMIHPEDCESLLQIHQRVIESGEQCRQEFRSDPARGPTRYFSAIIRRKDAAIGPHRMLAGTIQDITEERNTANELKRLASVVTNSNELVSLATIDGKMTFLNRAGSKILGIPPETVLSSNILQVVPDHLLEKIQQEILPRLKAGGSWEGDLQYRNLTTGVLTDVHAMLFAIKDSPTGLPLYIANVSLDITERKLFERTLADERNLMRTLIDNLPDNICVKDMDGRKILANRADLNFIGLTNEKEALGKTDAAWFPADVAAKYRRDDELVLKKGQAIINQEELVLDASGHQRCMLTSKLPLKNVNGEITGLVGIGHDITDRKNLESKLLTMTHYDGLTKLPNRTLFFERAHAGLAQAKRSGASCAFLFIDLDHFKKVNDTLGHAVGDELIQDTAIKLLDCIREMDTIARLGGDEFIVFLHSLESAHSAQHIAERIRERFNTPRQVAGNDLFITASIGIAIYPNDGESLSDLFKNADTAMYAAKEAGRNTYCFFNNQMNQKAVTKMQVERGLRRALEKNEFRIFYQPIISIKDGRIRGFEALLRWFIAGGGLVSPTEFIPVAEETGIIVPIGDWVFKQACLFNKKLMDAGLGQHIMSVNISVVQLRRKNIVNLIKAALDESGLPPACLEVEITESLLIPSFSSTMEILQDIHDLGVKASLDDFGTGYSSLRHLKHLPIANLKIDRLFIHEILTAKEDGGLTPAIIDLAHKLKLGVVAEGVETKLQLDRLSREGCDFYQGFLFSKPMPEDKVMAFLKDHQQQSPA